MSYIHGIARFDSGLAHHIEREKMDTRDYDINIVEDLNMLPVGYVSRVINNTDGELVFESPRLDFAGDAYAIAAELIRSGSVEKW
mgnify:FL=1